MNEHFDEALKSLLNRITNENLDPDKISMLAHCVTDVCVARLNYFGEEAAHGPEVDPLDQVQAALDLLRSGQIVVAGSEVAEV